MSKTILTYTLTKPSTDATFTNPENNAYRDVVKQFYSLPGAEAPLVLSADGLTITKVMEFDESTLAQYDAIIVDNIKIIEAEMAWRQANGVKQGLTRSTVA